MFTCMYAHIPGAIPPPPACAWMEIAHMFVHTLPDHDPVFRVASECHGERTFDSKVFLATSCGFISDSATI